MTVEVVDRHAALADGQVLVMIDRPPVNALDLDHLEMLRRCFESLAGDPAPGGVILTGAGSCFSAGVDTKAWQRSSAAERREVFAVVDAMISAALSIPTPVGIAINGHTLGGGLVLALTGDIRHVTTGSIRIGLPEIASGIAFPDAAVALLRREVDPSAIRRLILRGEIVDPAAAVTLGLVDDIVDPWTLLATTSQAVLRAAAQPALPMVKRQFRNP